MVKKTGGNNVAHREGDFEVVQRWAGSTLSCGGPGQMCFGEFNHSAELGTEGIAVGEVTGLYGKPALPVNVDIWHRFGLRIGCRCVGLAFKLAHASGSWSAELIPYSYLNRIGSTSTTPLALRGETVAEQETPVSTT